MRDNGSMQPGDIIELGIDNVAHGGVFVGRVPDHDGRGRVVFTPDTLPGERVRVRVTEVKKSFARGETLEVIEASPDRVPHVWPEASIERAPADRAGGAEFGHIALSTQRQLKQRVIEDSLARVGGIERTVRVQAAPGDTEANGLGWRTRVRVHVDDRGRIGPFAARSHTVVPVTSLPLAVPQIQRDLQLDQRLPGVTSVDVTVTSTGDTFVIATEGEPVRGVTETIVERVGEREFQLDRAGFWQVHRLAPSILSDAVRRSLDASADPKAHHLDLYGGVGLFGAVIGETFGPATRVTSIESDEVATEHASENLAEWIGAHAISTRVDRWLRDAVRTASATERDAFRRANVVLDPPRSGAGTGVIDDLAELAPARIVYVACDPVALARDAKALLAHGYRLGALDAFDLFPHTHHVEAVATFER